MYMYMYMYMYIYVCVYIYIYIHRCFQRRLLRDLDRDRVGR